MTDRFDPADFDTPPPAPRGVPTGKEAGDYRTLLDAITRAAADGINEPVRRILARIDQDAATRAQWDKATAATLLALQQATEGAEGAAIASKEASTRLTRHAFLFALGTALAVAGTAWASLAWLRYDVERLRAERAELVTQVADYEARAKKLRLRGAALEWSTCTIENWGPDTKRKCVRIVVPKDTTGTFGSGPYYAIPVGY